MPPKAPHPDADPRLKLILDQALRALSQQQAAVEATRARAGALVSVAAFITPFFGRPLLDQADLATVPVVFTVLALASLSAVVVAAFAIFQPREFKFGISAHKLLLDYYEPPAPLKPADSDEMWRNMAIHIQDDVIENRRMVERLWRLVQACLAFLACEVVFWALALGTR